MKGKNTWLYLTVGALGVALFLAYKKRNVPSPNEKMSEGDDKEFYGMGGNYYMKPKNLIPNAYGRYRGYVNADDMPCKFESTQEIYNVCQCVRKNKVPPTILSNFR